MNSNKSISSILIYTCIIVTIFAYFFPNLYNFGINDIFIKDHKYYLVFIQFFLWTFLHLSITHLLFNCIFIYYFWNILELLMWKKKFLIFFIFSVLFICSMLFINISWNTIWISWFAMALLTYYTLELKSRNNNEYKGWITAIILNLIIWFLPSISLFWHFYWVIAWLIFYLLNKDFFRKKMVWIVN